MRRYFFDVRNGHGVIPDNEGMELSTMDAVQDEAAYSLAEMAKQEVRAANATRNGNGNGSARHLAIEVRDGDGPVMRAKFTVDIERLQ
jgi:hypothetical protein